MAMKKYAEAAALGLMVLLSGTAASAGIPECENLRLEEVESCELRGSLECSASCDELGVFKKACATRLHTSCRSECTLSANPRCQDECTTTCSRDCDIGVNVTCLHNCFGECVGSCEASCAGKDDVETCTASCEATCDGECDTRCRPLVDGDCYKHCIECCGGSCTAQANMDCQTVCQEEQFEECEYEFRADCEAECTGDGAIFCDGEYVLGGTQIPRCATALYELGIAELDLEVDGDGSIDLDDGNAVGAGKAAVSGCHLAAGPPRGGPFALVFALAGLGLLARGRRR
jgi:hypothetical protein